MTNNIYFNSFLQLSSKFNLLIKTSTFSLLILHFLLGEFYIVCHFHMYLYKVRQNKKRQQNAACISYIFIKFLCYCNFTELFESYFPPFNLFMPNIHRVIDILLITSYRQIQTNKVISDIRTNLKNIPISSFTI